MSSGKETPRQKMIGMMYLVLTALLALNVSKEILKGFVTVDESIEKSKVILNENNLRVQKAFEDYVNQGNYEAKPYLLKSVEAQQHIRLVDAYIDSMKLMVIQKTENPSKRDTSQLRFMDKLDDFDTPTYLLIGSNEAAPINTAYSAKALRLTMENLHKELTAMLDHMQKEEATALDPADLNALKQKLSSIMPTDRNIQEDGLKLNWELENFYHMPMAAVITNLNKIQADMKNVESEFLHVFSSASGKFTIKVNKLEAKVIAPTAYVLAGQPFKADIVLGASSTDLSNERMKVLIGAEYDTISKSFKVPGSELSVAGGMGKFESSTSVTGQKKIKGVVVYKNPKGKDEYYPFDYTYMVAPAFSTVSADNMNIFYEGVSNPLSVSAAGFAPSELRITATGCGAEVQAGSGGMYALTVKGTGTCVVTVSAKVNGVYQQQGPPKSFRVKPIPPAVLKVGGKLATANLEFTKGEVKQIGGLGAESPGFMFPVNMIVKSFEVFVVKRGKSETFICSGNNLTPEAKTSLSTMNAGDKIYLENVKVQKPTGMSTLPSVMIKVKS